MRNWVFSQFGSCYSFILKMSHFQLLSSHNLIFSDFIFFWFCHNLSFWVVTFRLSFVITWVFEFCHNLSGWVLSQFEFLWIIFIVFLAALSSSRSLVVGPSEFVNLWICEFVKKWPQEYQMVREAIKSIFISDIVQKGGGVQPDSNSCDISDSSESCY